MNHGSTLTRHLVDGPQPHPCELILQASTDLGSRDLGFRGFEFKGSGFGFRSRGLGFEGFEFRGLGFGFRV